MPGYRKTMGSRYPKVSMKSLPAAVRMASTGEFIVQDNDISTGATWAVGTTYSTLGLGSTTTSILYPKIEMWAWLFSSAVRLPLIVAVVKMEPNKQASDYDISDETVLEQLRSEGRLFYHHWHYMPAVASTAERVPAPFHFVWKNVKLDKDEILAVLWRTRVATADGVLWRHAKYSATDL